MSAARSHQMPALDYVGIAGDLSGVTLALEEESDLAVHDHPPGARIRVELLGDLRPRSVLHPFAAQVFVIDDEFAPRLVVRVFRLQVGDLREGLVGRGVGIRRRLGSPHYVGLRLLRLQEANDRDDHSGSKQYRFQTPGTPYQKVNRFYH